MGAPEKLEDRPMTNDTDEDRPEPLGNCPTCKTTLKKTYSVGTDGVSACAFSTVADLSLCMACGEAIVFDGRLRLARQSDLDAFGSTIDVLELLRLTLCKLRARGGKVPS